MVSQPEFEVNTSGGSGTKVTCLGLLLKPYL